MKFSIDSIRDIKNLIRELSVGLTKLAFLDNFESFEWSGTIDATSTVTIRNKLKNVPTKRIIVKQSAGALISDSSTTWTTNFVYLQNHSATPVTVTVIFFN